MYIYIYICYFFSVATNKKFLLFAGVELDILYLLAVYKLIKQYIHGLDLIKQNKHTEQQPHNFYAYLGISFSWHEKWRNHWSIVNYIRLFKSIKAPSFFQHGPMVFVNVSSPAPVAELGTNCTSTELQRMPDFLQPLKIPNLQESLS